MLDEKVQGFELIARLSYSTTRWDGGPAGHSEGRLTRVELAGLLKSLSHEQLTLVLAKYGGDQNAVLECVRLTQLWTHARALRLDWQQPTGDLFDKMAESLPRVQRYWTEKSQGLPFMRGDWI